MLSERSPLGIKVLVGNASSSEKGNSTVLGDFQKINYSFSRIIIILGVWEVGIDGCPLLPIL
jgi:hypothetical protein